jgi:hypothetical protein
MRLIVSRTRRAVPVGGPALARSVALCLALVVVACSGGGGEPPHREVGPDWMQRGMLAGLPVFIGQSDGELARRLDALVAQQVDVVIADSALSNYMTDASWDRQMALVTKVTKEAHRRGLKIVWYLTSLEVQTVGGRLSVNSMFKDHPDWVQVGIDGRPNVFFGNQEDWVDPDDESAWMCPISPYREYFLGRIKKLVGAGLDGIWVDVPAYMDTGSGWACACPRHRADFKSKTGLELGDKKDWTSEAFRRWVPYRHRELAEFQRAVHAAAVSVNPKIETIMEIFSTDTLDATETGLDATFMGHHPGLSHVWEIDSVSNTEGMLRAQPIDWLNKVAITKFAKGADKGRPTWVFSYGNTEWDAQMVFATAIAAQANPYETKTPEMATSVGSAFRTKLFGWVHPHKAAIYGSTSRAKVAVLYSAYTRDYMDNMYGFGLFSGYIPARIKNKSATKLDNTWWETDVVAAAGSTEFLGDYRGFVIALSRLHVPFAIETMQHQSAQKLAKYDLLIAPNFAALSDEQATMLSEYVAAGGNMLITGPAPSSLDDVGKSRSKLALAQLLGFDVGQIPPINSRHVNHHGKGRVTYVNAWLGRRYMRVQSEPALAAIETIVRQNARRRLETDAHQDVYLDLYEGKDELVLHALNFVDLDASDKPPTPQEPKVALRLPAGKRAVSAIASTPDDPSGDKTLTLTAARPGVVELALPLTNYTLVRITLEDVGDDTGSLTVDIGWPAGLAGLTLTARVSDGPSLTARSVHLQAGASSATIDGLSPGTATVELITHAGPLVVGQARRAVTIEAGKQTALAFTPGVDLGSVTAISARQHDELFFYNSGAAAVTLDVEGVKTSIPAKAAVGHRFDKQGSIAFAAGSTTGAVEVNAADAAAIERTPVVSGLGVSKGYAGHALEIKGSAFGSRGRVEWGGSLCRVIAWSEERIVALIPDSAKPSTQPVIVDVGGARSAPRSFEVLANPVQRTSAIDGAYAFMTTKMTSPLGGVYTNFVDVEDPPDAKLVYPNGHHQTAEHTGLLLWVSAALVDHPIYERTFTFIRDRMVSPRRGIVNWAIDKTTNQPMLQEAQNSNAPLDDFRVVKALFAGWDLWRDPRYLDLALRIGRGLFETSISDDYDRYIGGLVAYGHNWKEHKGIGKTDADPIPVDYSDLYAIKRLMAYDVRWKPIYDSGVKFLEDAQIASSGQYWNAFTDEKFAGDFEYPKTPAGMKIKTIQSLWIAIHLARADRTASARRALDFYKSFYRTHKRIAEYYNPDGTEPTESYFAQKLKGGEPRIYAQVVRLALYLGQPDDVAFAKQVIAEKLESDLVTSGPVAGHIGKSAEQPGDANAYNSLESLLALAFAQGSSSVAGK